MESFYSREDADSVAKRTRAKVVVVPTGVTNQRDSDNYISMLDNVVTRLASALSEVQK
jgi:ABC-type Zn uptake system ZnuABC Zn-binding protein ZnuA